MLSIPYELLGNKVVASAELKKAVLIVFVHERGARPLGGLSWKGTRVVDYVYVIRRLRVM